MAGWLGSVGAGLFTSFIVLILHIGDLARLNYTNVDMGPNRTGMVGNSDRVISSYFRLFDLLAILMKVFSINETMNQPLQLVFSYLNLSSHLGPFLNDK